MSTVLSNPRTQRSSEGDWSRLIPGVTPLGRKLTKATSVSLRPFAVGNKAASSPEIREYSGRTLRTLIPAPLAGRGGLSWLKSVTADWTAVALSWLVLVASVSGLETFYPNVQRIVVSADPLACVGYAILQAALITLLGYTEGLYTEHLDTDDRAWLLAKSVAWTTTVLCLAQALQGATWSTAFLFSVSAVLDFGGLYGWRWWTSRQEGTLKPSRSTRNVLIVGAARTGYRIAAHMQQHPDLRGVVCGFLDDDVAIGGEVIGRTSDLARCARKKFVDEIILVGPRDADTTRRVLEDARRLRLDVQIVPELFGCAPVESDIQRVAGVPVICLHAERLPAAALLLKRAIDVIGAASALIILSPLLILIAMLTRWDSAGPVFYCAQRAGRKGRSFRCYKFRTMVANADELKEGLRGTNERSGPFFKLRNDPRITGLGKVLRRYSLDELPQLWNVLKGDMSLVGPRPHPLDDVASYEVEHLGRLDVTPGLTGLWQVTARRDPSFRRGLELDREYIRTWSLSLDFRILLRTFRAVLCGSGD